MTIFGPQWDGHPDAIFEHWQRLVTPEDLVLIPGDISWAMHLAQALPDLQRIGEMPGTKVLLRGNHDYWWSSAGKIRAALPPGMHIIQNDALRFGNVVVCGTRGWLTPGYEALDAEDSRLLQREAERLKLSVGAAERLRQPGDTLVMMLHYPPASPPYAPNPLSEVIVQAQPDLLLYGHLHGVPPERAMSHLGSIPAHLVAADGLKFVPKLVLEANL